MGIFLALAELVLLGKEVFAGAPPHLSPAGCTLGQCSLVCVTAVSECSLRKPFSLFLTIGSPCSPQEQFLLRACFCQVLTSLWEHTQPQLPVPLAAAPAGQTFSVQCAPGSQPAEAAVPPRGFGWFCCSLDSAEGQVLSPCAPACPEESPGVRQFGEAWGGVEGVWFSSCSAVPALVLEFAISGVSSTSLPRSLFLKRKLLYLQAKQRPLSRT